MLPTLFLFPRTSPSLVATSRCQPPGTGCQGAQPRACTLVEGPETKTTEREREYVDQVGRAELWPWRSRSRAPGVVQDVDSFQEQDGGDGNWSVTTRCLQGLAPKMDRGLTRATDAQFFSFHDAAVSTWEVRFDVLVVRLSGGGSLCSSLVVPAPIQVRGATTEKENVSALLNSIWTWRCLGSSVPLSCVTSRQHPVGLCPQIWHATVGAPQNACLTAACARCSDISD